MADLGNRSSDGRVPIEPQTIDAPLTRHAVFLVLTVAPGSDSLDAVRSVLSDVDGLVKTVGFRDLGASFTCTVGIGAAIWPGLAGLPLPRELHEFTTIAGARHTAPSTPGDLLFHIRSDRQDLRYEFERLLLEALGEAVAVEDETIGFRYLDTRDLLGFVDGTANPVGDHLPESTLVGEEDLAAAGGSYVVVQKYLHPLASWQALTTEQQEAIIGRRKADNVELDDADSGQKAHKTLATIVDDAGVEHDILRDNMPFGSPGTATFGTYFIGYSRELWVIERMLERMFIGDPPGLHDRLLDFSEAVTGTVFFAPSAEALSNLGSPPPPPPPAPATRPVSSTPEASPPSDESDPPEAGTGSLGLGGLRRTPTTPQQSGDER
ncbi:Dyp-type peroxidase [Herbiconiux ginsengi]|uniref:Putative iron-dependent peroxidase n=1 Tax=Herbiconiux ginsengi TaxID=381665 RepID=A0A1H3TSC7_9MICO|nr:Dyp-type peroxidase [Herbiconiux ginsengi]SDZ52585.1 putative iron-dependent peroxidase [Herbiconiux ginsengi]